MGHKGSTILRGAMFVIKTIEVKKYIAGPIEVERQKTAPWDPLDCRNRAATTPLTLSALICAAGELF